MLKGHPTSMRLLKLMDALYLAYSRSSSPHWPVPGIHLLLELGIERSLWPLLVLSRASLSRCSESNSGLAMACEKNQNKLINERMWWGFRLFFNFHLPPSIPLPTEWDLGHIKYSSQIRNNSSLISDLPIKVVNTRSNAKNTMQLWVNFGKKSTKDLCVKVK